MNKNPRKILVVDDQEGWRDAITAILEDADYSVQATRTCDEAKAILHSQVFDLVIIDIRLEERVSFNVAGVDLLQWVWERKKGPPAIILTGHGTPALEQRAKWYGAFAFLDKSDDEHGFNQEPFLKAVGEAMAGRVNYPV